MSRREHPNYNDYAIATMYRVDPEKLAQIRRIVTGMTRCPECDALNPADQKRCEKCGAKLYPEVEDEPPPKEEEPYVPPKKEKEEKDNRKVGDSDKPPYY
jgi:ribosomal protein L40E